MQQSTNHHLPFTFGLLKVFIYDAGFISEFAWLTRGRWGRGRIWGGAGEGAVRRRHWWGRL